MSGPEEASVTKRTALADRRGMTALNETRTRASRASPHTSRPSSRPRSVALPMPVTARSRGRLPPPCASAWPRKPRSGAADGTSAGSRGAAARRGGSVKFPPTSRDGAPEWAQ